VAAKDWAAARIAAPSRIPHTTSFKRGRLLVAIETSVIVASFVQPSQQQPQLEVTMVTGAARNHSKGKGSRMRCLAHQLTVTIKM
jgi:hypothetical protein